MHRYDRIWQARDRGHLTTEEAMDLCVYYLRLAEVLRRGRWVRFMRRLGNVDPGRMNTSLVQEPRELLCQLCDRDYTVWFAPSDIWNAVMRGGDRANPDEYPFVCLTCFSILAEERGIVPTAWVLDTERSPVQGAERIRNRR